MTILLNDPITQLAFSVYENKGVFAILLGSGLSRSADIPAGWEITLDLVCRVATAQGVEEQQDWAKWYREQIGQQPNYSRMLNGYWVHFAPLGYKYASKPGHGKVLVRNVPLASIVAEGLEGYASGRFQLRAEVKRFFEQFPQFPKNAKGEVSNEHVYQILSRVIYAGHIQSDIMDVSLRPAQNEPLISLAKFQKIQDRMQEKAKIPARKNLNEDFPLRAAVRCTDCDNPLTACWTKGRSKYYPYYYCFTSKRCESYGKAIKREKIEGEFEALLHTLEPSVPLFKTATKMFETWRNYRQAQIGQRGKALEDEIRKLGGKIEQLMDRLVDTDSDAMVKAYETRIKKFETNRAVLVEKSGQSLRPMRSFDAAPRTSLDFIAKPHKLWSSGRLCDRHAVLGLAFPGGLQYHRNTGLRTTDTPLPFKVLGGLTSKRFQLAERESSRLLFHHIPASLKNSRPV